MARNRKLASLNECTLHTKSLPASKGITMKNKMMTTMEIIFKAFIRSYQNMKRMERIDAFTQQKRTFKRNLWMKPRRFLMRMKNKKIGESEARLKKVITRVVVNSPALSACWEVIRDIFMVFATEMFLLQFIESFDNIQMLLSFLNFSKSSLLL